MANSALQLTSIDFDTLKENFKTFLSEQTVFKDYNFEGSNMNVLLDVMSYNSYLNSFYLNMIGSEMFLDSAQKFDSVVSHAKELNYVPKSSKSAEAQVSFSVVADIPSQPLTIKKGTKFSGSNANGSFVFVTDQEHSYTSPNTTFTVSNLAIYEGKLVSDSFIVNYADETQKFVLSNPTVDTDSIEVVVTENSVNTIFTKVSTLYGLTSVSNVYFLQAAQSNQYEIVFGDGFLGRRPLNSSVVTFNYRINSGTDAIGVTSFALGDDLGTMNNGYASISDITVNANSAGGANAESIDSVKFAAPRYFATQQRAVSSDDYSSLVLANFGNLIADVNVYGGELLEPKQYGRVVLALKPQGGTVAPDYVKNEISNFLTPYIALPNRVIVSDPDYLYCEVKTIVSYDKASTTKTPVELKNIVLNTIKQFSTDHIEVFGADLRYSKIVAHIDDSDPSITSNDTEISIIKRIAPKLNYASTFNIDFNNPTELEELSPGYTRKNRLSDEPMLTSTAFTYVDDNGVEYPLSYIRDDNFGVLIVYSVINNVFTILKDGIGTIDYTTGKVIINNLKTSAYDNYISIKMTPQNKDIVVNNNKILLIDVNDVTVNVIQALV